MILTYQQAGVMLAALGSKKEDIQVSLDLGVSNSKVKIAGDSFIFPDSQAIGADKLKKIIKKDTICFSVENNEVLPISIFSEETNNYYKLVPTGSWPTVEISGIRMHVTKSMNPKEDTIQKISFVSPCIGAVLDTCTGLGYTAIWAARTADKVHTFERDANIIEIEKINPWSAGLFTDTKIKRHHEDIFDGIKKIKGDSFDRIIHDPPRQALSNLLYSQDFYDQMFRVLKTGGKLFHYTGDPGAKTGHDIRAGIIKRLTESGFVQIRRVYNGLAAEKL